MPLFDTALAELAGKRLAFWGPKSFRDFLASQGISENNKTAQYISVDSLEGLHPSLRANNVMVLRLGASEGLGTQFGLVKAEGRLSDFFLIDSEVFCDTEAETFRPSISEDKLMPFRLLPTMSETGLVNFAFASGLLAHALRLDDEHSVSAQATGASTFTFDVRLHSELDVVIRHKGGQVQIDSLFVGRRQGREIMFVLEAKSNPTHKSLAKHKLVYPLLALVHRVPADMPIVPVYLKVSKAHAGLRFSVAECVFPDTRKTLAGINELRTGHSTRLIVPEWA